MKKEFFNKLFALLVFFFLIILINTSLYAQEVKAKNFSIGYSVGTNSGDYSLNINITTPFMFNVFAIRLNWYVCFNEFINKDYNSWFPYYALKVGFIGSSQIINNYLRFYGEGGLAVVFTNDEVSSKKINYGGYGLFGFEFFLSYNLSYYIEIGGNGLSVKADNLINSPDFNRIYFNGFLCFAGLRYYF